MIKFTVPGIPVPKGRPRAHIITPFKKKPFIVFYTPKETEEYEKWVKLNAKQAMEGRPPLDCSCEATIRVYIPVPESWSNKKTAQCLTGELKPPSKADLDNYVKNLDGLNGIVFTDDALLWRIDAEKNYSDNPRMEFEITEYVPTNILI